MSGAEDRAREAARGIAHDLSDRSGIEMCDFDEDIQREVYDEIAATLTQHARSEVRLVLEEAADNIMAHDCRCLLAMLEANKDLYSKCLDDSSGFAFQFNELARSGQVVRALAAEHTKEDGEC